MVVKTRVTELLGIKHPVIMGGMTGVGTVELAAAVSNAGGLGLFAVHNAGSPEASRLEIRRLRSILSNNKPFGVNLTILPAMGQPPPYAEYARVIIEEKVPIVETAGSNPKKWVSLFKAAGIITIHKCVTIRHALSAQRLGVDIISLDGFECAGHPGEGDIGNFVLQARGAQVLTTPFICSGGVGDGKQIAAALALGADGVNCGTRFCATQECNWPASFKRRMIEATEEDTVLMFRNLKNTTRVFANKVAREVQRIESEKGEDLEFRDLAHLVAGARGRAAENAGDPDGGIWTAGQVIGLIDDLPSVAELMKRLMDECEDTIKGRLNKMIVMSRL